MEQKIMCSTKGLLHSGKAMCGYVIVSDKSCSLKTGECALQRDANLRACIPVQVQGQTK